MESRRVVDTKLPRKDGEMKRLAKFYAVDRPPRKRLRTVLDFLKHPNAAGLEGNLVGTVQQLLQGTTRDANTPTDNTILLGEFWGEGNNASMLFDVLCDCVTELETLYVAHENAFRRKRKTLEAEDWNDVFEGLEALICNNIASIHEGWKRQGLTKLFIKLLKRDNHALIKKYAFRCLALYTDATRNLQQLVTLDTSEDHMNEEGFHLQLLRESVDFSPYGGGTIQLPDKFVNEGVHVEGWMRPFPTQAEEPVDMLKFMMDLSLEREDPKILQHPKINHGLRGDRFEFWSELIMRFYMPLLFPKICIKAKWKEEGDTLGFFHHCPGSFQRVIARWIYKLRSKPECMEILWTRRECADVIMETVRQRFAYRDNELVLDAIKFYSGICTGGQYIPTGMQSQIHETCRAMISHVSQLFHPSVQLEDSKILLHCIELLEVISQRDLDEYTTTYLRKFVLSTIDNCIILREPANLPILSAMLSVVLHVWMHTAIISNATGQQVWMELTTAVRRWLLNLSDAKTVGIELIRCWKHELRFISCLLMVMMDDGQSMIKITADGAILVPATDGNGKLCVVSNTANINACLQSAATFLTSNVHNVNDATVLLDRMLHLIPPSSVSGLAPFLHLGFLEGLLQLVELWIDSAICSQRSMPTVLHRISPSTVLALFGAWFLPACEIEDEEYQTSRCLAIVIMCKLCSVRCANPLTSDHVTILSRLLFKGITSPSGVVVSTVLQCAASIFTLNLDGMNALVPVFIYAVDQIIIQNIWERSEAGITGSSETTAASAKTSDWNRELTAALDIVFSLFSLQKRYPDQNFVDWHAKLELSSTNEQAKEIRDKIMEEVPTSNEHLHVILARILVRIARLPFMDIVAIKKRALWGLYILLVTHLPNEMTPQVERQHLSDWIVHLMDFCYALDFSVSMTALAILQDLSEFHTSIDAILPMFIPRIVMTLAVFAQQQVEEASVEVQAAVEGNRRDASKDSIASTYFSTVGSTREHDSDHPDTDAPKSSKSFRTNDSGSRKNSMKETTQDSPALRMIVQKTAAIFECLRFWLMVRSEVLHDNNVKKILFSAIEAALVGTIPDGEWQQEVQRERRRERRESMPLLFLGLQMRASLDTQASQSWLKCFEETSLAAEGLLLHLLHHINGFPSPAGVDQMVSNCTELGCDQVEDDQGASLSFVYMDSVIVSVVGSVDSPCARFIARDMTGVFTWDIMPTGSTPIVEGRTEDKAGAVNVQELMANSHRDKTVRLHSTNATPHVEFKSLYNENGLCSLCGRDKSHSVSDLTRPSSDVKMEVLQLPRHREESSLNNSLCSSKNSYVYHDDDELNPDVDTKQKNSPNKGESQEKMPGLNGGNRDERLERLELVAKQHEERNKSATKIVSTTSLSHPKPRVCECVREINEDQLTTICGLFEMYEDEPNIGSLDDERCLLDLVLDSIPMIFRDCGGDTTDKTILGGRYAMTKYNLMDMDDTTNPLIKDSASLPGFSFLQRLIHDEECYSQLKSFISKDDRVEGKELIEFCDSIKRFERTSNLADRLGQACTIYWEFMTVDGGRQIQFPNTIATHIQHKLQQAQKNLRSGDSDQSCSLSGSLFQEAMTHIETMYFDNSGLLDRYIQSLDTGGSKSSSNENIPSQLHLFDSFSIMELNARIAHLALTYRDADEVQSATSSALKVRSSRSYTIARVTALDTCRLFLSQCKLLPTATAEATIRRRFKLLENGPRLERSLKHLDNTPVRETMKIGVIYVDSQQCTQQEILANDRGNAAYNRFLVQLGWEIDLATHRGFAGGLDCNPKSLSNGTTSLYYATGHSEVMFHVVTMMPTKPFDPQQIDKKRHVGNDFVHIIWSENDTQAYDPATITSRFDHVQIVIYPLRRSQEGLYLVHVHMKDKITPFGPIQSGMVLHESDLVQLVRQTAMNANRMCRSQTSIYVQPYPTRKKLVDEIVERYATEYQESQLLTMLFASLTSNASLDGN